MYVKHPYAAVSLSVHKMLLKTSRPYFSKALQKSVRGFEAVLSEHAHKVALFVNLKAKQKKRGQPLQRRASFNAHRHMWALNQSLKSSEFK